MMGFTLEFKDTEKEIMIQLPKTKSLEAWELAKKIVDIYFSQEPTQQKEKP